MLNPETKPRLQRCKKGYKRCGQCQAWKKLSGTGGATIRWKRAKTNNDWIRDGKTTYPHDEKYLFNSFFWLNCGLFCFTYRKIQKEVIQKKDKNVSTSNGGSLSPGNLNVGFEIETTTTTSADSTTVTTVSTPGTRRRRKKKMPCARPHYQFNYLDEGILLEDKPLSTTTKDMYNYSYVTVDTSPVCTCHHNGYLQAGFDLLPYSRDYLTPTSSTPTGRLPYTSRKGRVFLPESFV